MLGFCINFYFFLNAGQFVSSNAGSGQFPVTSLPAAAAPGNSEMSLAARKTKPEQTRISLQLPDYDVRAG